MLNIFYGRDNVDKEKFIDDCIKKTGGKTFVIVPDQFTLDRERSIFDNLGATCLMDIEVISMSRLGFRLLGELGGLKRTFIDKYGRHMILSDVASEDRDKLKVFRGLETKDSFIDYVNNFISEMKQFGCTVEDISTMAEKLTDDTYLKGKLEDIYLIFSGYEERIKGKYTDSEDYIDLYLGKIKDSQMIKDSKIWVFGFDSFAPKALDVLGELMTYADDVNVVLSFDDYKKARDKGLWLLSELVIANLVKTAEARKVEHSLSRIPDDYRIKRASSIENIERELYAVPFKRVGFSEGLKLVSAANIYNEAETAAAYVLELVRDKGYKLSDIKVICNDQETRGPILKRFFMEYGMELFSDAKKDVSDSPVVESLLLIMSIVLEKYRTPDIIGYLKLGFTELTNEEITDLENYAIKYKIRGSMWKKPFKKGRLEYGQDGLTRLNSIRERAMSPVLGFEKIVLGVSSNGEFTDALYEYMYDELKLPEKIKAFAKKQNDCGMEDLALETTQIWGKMIEILDQMKEISGTEKFDLRRYMEVLLVGISQIEIGVLPPTKDGLMMGTMQRTRTGSMKALIVVGANEGVMPQEKVSKGLFTGDEKDLFKDRGVELCKVDSIMLLEERMGIYRNLSKPLEILYVSYSMADADGKELKESAVFTKLRSIFPNVLVEKDVLNSGDETRLVNGSLSGKRHLTEALNRVSLGNEIDGEWREVLDWYKRMKPLDTEKLKDSISFTNHQEKLGREISGALFKKDVDKALSLSPSRIEKYSRCPFSHFVSYGLKADEIRAFEVAPREIGDVYHACLMKLTERLTEEGKELTAADSPWMTITYEDCEKMVTKLVSDETENYREGVFKSGNSEIYRAERLSEALTKVSWNMIEQVRAGYIMNASFETKFGRNREIKPIEITLENDKAYIEGIIDRVDYLRNDRVKIIDYKTGDEKFDTHEAEEGYRLQLMLYLKAAMEDRCKPAGVFYFHVHEPMTDMTGKGEDMIDSEIQKEYKLNGIMVNNPEVIRDIAGEFTGHSKIAPVSIGKDGIKGNVLSEEEFEELSQSVERKVTEICQDLVDGVIDVSPMKTKEKSACTYCGYKGICRFDTIFEGCRWRVI